MKARKIFPGSHFNLTKDKCIYISLCKITIKRESLSEQYQRAVESAVYGRVAGGTQVVAGPFSETWT